MSGGADGDAAPLETLPLDPSNRAELSKLEALFRVVWPESPHLSAGYLDWLYRANPDGGAVGYNAVDPAGNIVGHYAVQPQRSLVEGKPLTGALSLNTAVHPSARGRGLFQKLAKATYARCAEQGMRFVVGVANAMSAPLFWRVFKFQALGPMDVWAGLGSPPIDARSAERIRYERLWSPEAIRWRLARPGSRYALGRSGPSAVVLASGAGPAGIRADLGAVPGIESTGLTVSRAPLRVWAGLDPRRRSRWVARIPVPVRWRPSPLHVIFKDLAGGTLRLERDSTLMQLIDFDAY